MLKHMRYSPMIPLEGKFIDEVKARLYRAAPKTSAKFRTGRLKHLDDLGNGIQVVTSADFFKEVGKNLDLEIGYNSDRLTIDSSEYNKGLITDLGRTQMNLSPSHYQKLNEILKGRNAVAGIRLGNSHQVAFICDLAEGVGMLNTAWVENDMDAKGRSPTERKQLYFRSGM